MGKNITNLEISSIIFSEVLKKNNLVLISEKNIEVANPYHNASIIRLTKELPHYEYYIQNGFQDPTIFYKNKGANFIYNGTPSPDLYEYVNWALLNKCSINIGKTTNDAAEYLKNKYYYLALKQHIIDKFKIDNNPKILKEIEEANGEYKTFILSYRKK